MQPRRFLVSALAAGLLVAAASPALRADTPALSLTGGTFKNDVAASVGYEFTVSQTISVTQLGYYNGLSATGGPGFQSNVQGVNDSHEVGIYDNAGVLQGSKVTVTYDGTPAAAGSFIYVPVTPFTLNPGT